MLKIIAVTNDSLDFETILWLNNFNRKHLFLINSKTTHNIKDLIVHNLNDDYKYYLIFENLINAYPIFFENPEKLLEEYKDDNNILKFNNLDIYLGKYSLLKDFYTKNDALIKNVDDGKYVANYTFAPDTYIYKDFCDNWKLINSKNGFRRVKHIKSGHTPTVLVILNQTEYITMLNGMNFLLKYFYPNQQLKVDYLKCRKEMIQKKLLMWGLGFIVIIAIIIWLTRKRKS